MSFTETKRREIRNYILTKIDENDPAFIAKTVDAFSISGTSVRRYIDSLTSDGHIFTKSGRECGYDLISQQNDLRYDISHITDREDSIIFNDILPLLSVNESAKRIWCYVITEMFNNAIEHSEGRIVRAHVFRNILYTRIVLEDDGVGIFNKVMDTLKERGNPDPLIEDAVAELYKGKFTSAPDRHTGEGIFFSMRMMDRFAIASDGNVLRNGYDGEPAVVRSHLLAYAMKFSDKGTIVIMQLNNETKRTPAEVFREYSDIDEGFFKTRIPVLEACMGRDPVARSQARRLSGRLDDFREVVLDFANVDMMGQGFANEMFRVYQNAHPGVVLTPVNMNEFVTMMYYHAVNTK
ncbi:MAG: DUF4325 domain-containing protein [Lachnospiraceae bacterium]|nr:DUF4325 domain-containing protein [Lachnospiraceae bacterium]